MIGFYLRETGKNLLMRVPAIVRVRKRLYSSQNDPAEELARQDNLIWASYVSALARAGETGRLTGAGVLEIGPGPLLGTGVRFIASGAAEYTALERFDLYRTDEAARTAYQRLIGSMDEEQRGRCRSLVKPAGEPMFDERLSVLRLTIEEAGAQLPEGRFDIVSSYNVLEHVVDVPGALRSMHRLLRPGGLALHRVDVSTHADRKDFHPLWQLTVADGLWRAMYSRRSYPNRFRPGDYRHWAVEAGFQEVLLEPTTRLAPGELAAIRPRLQPRWRTLDEDDLTILDFVWVLRRPAGPGLYQ